ncbi:MAG: Holliday junction resolvase YqgF, putative holliday junction resolvase [Candidatus Adlerbacteria bacterium]|nr:Holliday junction resolvase YqgF, putative holliday junction resolvase [Candidatus Adlerbacteria bacterium]
MATQTKYIGIDYGTKRTGVAISDDTGSLAFPLTTLVTSNSLVDDIAALATEHKAHVVIGESRDFSGAPNPVMKNIAELKAALETRGVVVHFEQELFSSALSARQFTPDGSRKANPSQEKLDASAAAVILQSYLDRNKARDRNKSRTEVE